MKTGKIKVVSFQISCPHCDEAIPYPGTESMYWTREELELRCAEDRLCYSCNRSFRMPSPR